MSFSMGLQCKFDIFYDNWKKIHFNLDLISLWFNVRSHLFIVAAPGREFE